MTLKKIVLTQSEKDALAAARRAGESRKYLWRAIRSKWAIPTRVILAVTVDKELYVKGSNPKQFLMEESGKYRLAQAVAEAPAPAAPARFAVMGDKPETPTAAWLRMDLDTALEILRDSMSGEDLATLPPDFPAVAEADDVLIFDNETQSVYFKL